MSIKSITISAKLSFLISIILITTLFVLPKDSCGNICGSFFILPLIIIFLVFSVFDLIKKKFHKLSFVIIPIILLLLFSIVFTSPPPCRFKAYEARTISEMHLLRSSQEIFYAQNYRYADTQEELVNEGLIDEKFKNRITEKELTDRDGNGIEGGDDDPETWSVTAYIPYREIDAWCRVINEGHWFTCNQVGCQRE